MAGFPRLRGVSDIVDDPKHTNAFAFDESNDNNCTLDPAATSGEHSVSNEGIVKVSVCEIPVILDRPSFTDILNFKVL